MKTRLPIGVAIAALATMIARPSLAAVVTNVTVPFTETVANPCNGDQMAFSEIIHLLATTTIDSAGVQTTFHFNEEDSRATDLSTGAQCVDKGNLDEHALNFDFSTDSVTGLPVTLTARFTSTTVCGSSGGVLFQILAHATIKPDGTVAVLFDNSSNPTVKCIGSGG